VGSHRPFVLSRGLRCGKVAALRFDYRGMGDATGPARPFGRRFGIAAAMDAAEACPAVEHRL
jgi:hypothetical protein